MLNPELFEKAVNDLVHLYQEDDRQAKKLEEETVPKITNNYRIAEGEEYDQEDYYRRRDQHVEYHRLTAERLLGVAQDKVHKRLYQNVVDQTVKALHVVAVHFSLRDLEKEATPLFVERPDLPADYILPHGGGIGDALRRKDQILGNLQVVRDKIALIFSPLVDHELEAYSNSIIVPYGDQLVEIESEYSPENAVGKLVGIQDCVVNVGIETTAHLGRQLLRTYPTDAYKRYCLCLELDGSEGNLRHSKPPVGISKNLAGLQKIFIPVEDLDNGWNGLRYGRVPGPTS